MSRARTVADLIHNSSGFPTGYAASKDGNNDLVIRYNDTTDVFRLTDAGALVAKDEITAFGTP